MLHYKDMSFCNSDCTNTECFRNLTPKVLEEAKRWSGDDSPAIAVIDFSKTCKTYTPKEKTDG